ncbi:tetratricopeptide repeat protein [Candidatus Woesearchaeota archaeon]|nr:tetratricopeptide repeat protein [Candidatus Woesearchaeota archaeon]
MDKTINELLYKLKKETKRKKIEQEIIPGLNKIIKKATLKDKIKIYEGIIEKMKKGYIKGIEPPEIFFNLADVYHRQSKKYKEIETLELAMNEYMKEGIYHDLERAISVGIKLIKKEENNPKILEKIGMCHKELNEKGDAINMYKRAAGLYEKRKDIIKAEGCYEEVAELQESTKNHPLEDILNTYEKINELTNDKEKKKLLEKRIREMKTEILLKGKDIKYNIKELDTIIVKEIEFYIKTSGIKLDENIVKRKLDNIIREIDGSHKKYIKNTLKIKNEENISVIKVQTMSAPPFGIH